MKPILITLAAVLFSVGLGVACKPAAPNVEIVTDPIVSETKMPEGSSIGKIDFANVKMYPNEFALNRTVAWSPAPKISSKAIADLERFLSVPTTTARIPVYDLDSPNGVQWMTINDPTQALFAARRSMRLMTLTISGPPKTNNPNARFAKSCALMIGEGVGSPTVRLLRYVTHDGYVVTIQAPVTETEPRGLNEKTKTDTIRVLGQAIGAMETSWMWHISTRR